MYFPGGESSRAEATQTLRELIGRARRKVTVVDPYFSIDDAMSLLQFVTSGRCKVRFLAGKSQLARASLDFTTEEFRFSSELARLPPKFPFSVEARKMTGTGAHDRWLQVDGAIYSLGSSINHFGERATMLFKLRRKLPLRSKNFGKHPRNSRQRLLFPPSKLLASVAST